MALILIALMSKHVYTVIILSENSARAHAETNTVKKETPFSTPNTNMEVILLGK